VGGRTHREFARWDYNKLERFDALDFAFLVYQNLLLLVLAASDTTGDSLDLFPESTDFRLMGFLDRHDAVLKVKIAVPTHLGFNRFWGSRWRHIRLFGRLRLAFAQRVSVKLMPKLCRLFRVRNVERDPVGVLVHEF